VNRTFLISRHEFRRTVRRTGFVVLTFALPLLALLAIGVSNAMSGITRPPAEQTRIGFVDQAGGFDTLATRGKVSFVRFDAAPGATDALLKGDVKEYFIIPPDFLATGIVKRFTTQREVTVPEGAVSAINDFMVRNLLAGKVPQSTVDRIESPLNLVSITLDPSGLPASEQGGPSNLVVPGVFGLLLALSLSFSSAYVLQGLAEEKENRLMEILLSSVSARQLVTGKVLGIGAAGLVQVVAWAISLRLLLNLASSSLGGFISTIRIPPNFLVLGVVYFVLGYLLFAVLSAAVAAVSSSVREGQGLASIFTMFAIAPFWFYSLLLLFPNSPVWVIFTIFPFSAPVLTMLRMGMTGVPAWQLIASMITLVLSIFGGLLLTARLLRTYLLMYGKRPGLREIARSLRSG
jgi:ABC-2 type transport system permease protein